MNRAMWGLVAIGLLFAVVLPRPVLAASPSTQPSFQAPDQSGGEELTKAKRFFLRGVELANSLKYLDAVEQFQLAIDENPDYVDAYRRLAIAYTAMADTDPDYYLDALDVYDDLAELLPPDDVELKKNKAYVQAAMGDLDDAIVTYEEILQITPEDCAMWAQIGSAEQVMAERVKAEKGGEDPGYMQRVNKAIDAYTKVTTYCPDEIEAYNTLGELYFNSGRTEESATVYSKMLEKDPQNEDIASRLAYLYYKAENWEKAAPAYKLLLELAPDRINDRTIYASVLQKLGRAKEAAAQYQKIIDADPTKVSLYCNLGFVYLEAKDWEKAIGIAMKGISEGAPQGCMYVIWGQGLEYKGDAQLQQYEYDRSIGSYEDAKLKLQNALGDANFGEYARKRMARIDQLIERAKQVKAKADQN
jgi:tetratricopeptide (TPR) repeat protein